MEELKKTAQRLVAPGKGIFAADASVKSITARLESYGIATDDENRRKYREVLFTTPGLDKYISGVIMHDESIRQQTAGNKLFREILSEEGVLVGIKVDRGTVDMPNFRGEKMTEGIDQLRERLAEYAGMGAKFTKWRAVVKIGEGLPTRESIRMNAMKLALFATLSQEAGMVPIVEPEVVMEGNHGSDRCAEVTEMTGKIVFEELALLNVEFEGMIYKVNMVLPGHDSGEKISDKEAAAKTVETLNKTVPVDCAGVVFLSGGQDALTATARLSEICKYDDTAWPMTFSFERALEQRVMEIWKGNDGNRKEAQEALLLRARMNSLAVQGKYEGES